MHYASSTYLDNFEHYVRQGSAIYYFKMPKEWDTQAVKRISIMLYTVSLYSKRSFLHPKSNDVTEESNS